MKQIPYWIDSAPKARCYLDRPLPERVDILVVGGGLTGLSTALHAAARGATVTLLEKETLGWGASSRNGGHCNPGITISLATAIRRYGSAAARSLFQVSLDAVDFVEELVSVEGIECEFERCGRLGVASKPAHFEQLKAKKSLLAREFNHETVLLSPSELRSEIGSEGYFGGLLDPAGARLHPVKLVQGLTRSAERAGADIHEHLPVLSVERRQKNGFVVKTPRGIIQAEQVMIATNGYSGGANPDLMRRILPIGSFIIATEELSENLVETIIPRRRNIVDTMNYSHYFRLSKDNRLIFGGRARFALSDPESDRKSGAVLRDSMRNIFPQLNDARIDYVWGGTVAFTLDRMPHAGEMNGIYYAMGYCGHGVQNATYLGKCMAEVMDGHPDANPWKQIEFPAVPYAAGWNWILPLAGAYYKFLDWLS